MRRATAARRRLIFCQSPPASAIQPGWPETRVETNAITYASTISRDFVIFFVPLQKNLVKWFRISSLTVRRFSVFPKFSVVKKISWNRTVMKMRFYLLLALFCSDSRAANIFERAPRNCYCRTLQLHHEKLSILNSRFCPSHGLRTPDKDFFQKCPKCSANFDRWAE